MPEKDHEKAAKQLEEAGRGGDANQAKFYREASRLVRNPKLQQAIKELEDNPDARKQAKQNPKGYFKGKGLDLPDEFQVEIAD